MSIRKKDLTGGAKYAVILIAGELRLDFGSLAI
jgi:hypothetical protein